MKEFERKKMIWKNEENRFLENKEQEQKINKIK